MATPWNLRARRALAQAGDAGVLALAIATAAGLALDAVVPGSAVHPLWMASTGVPPLDGAIAGAFAAAVVLRDALGGGAARTSRVAAAGIGCVVAGLAALALGRHLLALAAGSLRPAGLVPPATLVALALVVPWALGAWRRPRPPPARRAPAARGALTLGAGVVLVLAQIAAVGATDYRAEADAILVLGARVHPDGKPSGALLDRTRTACALWKEGLAPCLVLSGGRAADAPVSEPAAMREIARGEGVPDGALVLDEGGADTKASVGFVARLARERGWRRVLVVSHDYHLARVRLLAAREGLVVRTVPAEETVPGGWKALALAREVAAYLAAWATIGSR